LSGVAERDPGPQRERQERPPIPEGVTGSELDKSVRAELSSLHPGLAKEIAQRLVLAGELLDDDPETAYLHAAAAREKAARVSCIREAVGLAAYRTGRYAEALAELRTVRRLTGSNDSLPIMADCERGLGRPERALEMLRSDEARSLDVAGRVEMLIVASGARADLGELEAAVITLQVPELRSTTREPWLARLRSAYADALATAGRDAEAREWLELAAEVDEDGDTGAAERLAELDGFVFVDVDEDDDEADEDEDGDEAGDEAEAQPAVDLVDDDADEDDDETHEDDEAEDDAK
jgi:tetratricopeptide (TPR) repeat protein